MQEQHQPHAQEAPQDAPDRGSPSVLSPQHSVLDAPPAIHIERVTKRFRSVTALRDVSLHIGTGEVFGLLGPNGAGKSTLLKLLLGFLHPDKGTIKLFGSTDLTRAHARIGYLAEKPRYHGNFTGREYLQVHAGLSGFNSKDARTVADHSLRVVGLTSTADRRISTYSKGMTQRLGLAMLLAASGGRPPDLLLLDEPSSGLDPEGQVEIRDFILDCKRQGSTVLMSSHQLTEVEQICTAAAVLRAGRLALYTRLDTPPMVHIGARPREGALEIAPHLIAYLRGLHPMATVRGGERDGEPLFVSLPTGKSVASAAAIKAAALRALLDARWDIMSVYVESKDLETLYLQAVKSKAAKEPRKKDTTDSDISDTTQTRRTQPLGPLPVRLASLNGASATPIPDPLSRGPSTSPLPAFDPDVEAQLSKSDETPLSIETSQQEAQSSALSTQSSTDAPVSIGTSQREES